MFNKEKPLTISSILGLSCLVEVFIFEKVLLKYGFAYSLGERFQLPLRGGAFCANPAIFLRYEIIILEYLLLFLLI